MKKKTTKSISFALPQNMQSPGWSSPFFRRFSPMLSTVWYVPSRMLFMQNWKANADDKPFCKPLIPSAWRIDLTDCKMFLYGCLLWPLWSSRSLMPFFWINSPWSCWRVLITSKGFEKNPKTIYNETVAKVFFLTFRTCTCRRRPAKNEIHFCSTCFVSIGWWWWWQMFSTQVFGVTLKIILSKECINEITRQLPSHTRTVELSFDCLI